MNNIDASQSLLGKYQGLSNKRMSKKRKGASDLRGGKGVDDGNDLQSFVKNSKDNLKKTTGTYLDKYLGMKSQYKKSQQPFGGDKLPHNYKLGQLQQYTPEQVQLYKQLFGHLSPDSHLGKLASGDQDYFAEMEAPALRQYNQLIGNTASRFSGMGVGARNSTGFQNTMNQQNSDFALNLASKRGDLQRQAIHDLMGLSHQLLGERPTERALFGKQPHQMSTASKFGVAGVEAAGKIAAAKIGAGG